jgi:hypothetical protein
MPSATIERDRTQTTHTFFGRPAQFMPEWDRFTDAQKAIILRDTEATPGLKQAFNDQAAQGLQSAGITSTRITDKFFAFGMGNLDGVPAFCVYMVVVSAAGPGNITPVVIVCNYDLVM